MRWPPLLLLALVLVPAAAAKEGVRAELTSTVPLDARPATAIEVSWKLTSPNGPFNAVSVFVRLRDAGGGAATIAFARGMAHPAGLYSARATVPAGGIAGIEIGVRGTTDVTFPVVNDPFGFRRPLHLPNLAPGSACPVSHVDESVDWHAFGIAPGIGSGPAYPVGLGSDATLHLRPPRVFGSKLWAGQKVLWFSLPTYTGPLLVRGARLDAPGLVRFDRGNVPPTEILLTETELTPGGVTPPKGTRYRSSYTRIKAPGCYAYQVDGVGFSTIVVFRAS